MWRESSTRIPESEKGESGPESKRSGAAIDCLTIFPGDRDGSGSGCESDPDI